MLRVSNRITTLVLNSCLKDRRYSPKSFSSRSSLNVLSQSYLSHTQHSTMSDSTNENASQNLVGGSNEVHVQRYPEKDMLTISFNYNVNGKTKQFNLNRKIVEPLSSSLERIKLNISKIGKKPKARSQNEVLDNAVGVGLLIEGSAVDPTSTNNGDAWVEGAIMELNGRPYQIKANSPQVESMELPSCIMRNFITMPMITLINCDISDCKFTWYRRISSAERDEIEEDDRKRVEFDGRCYWYELSNEIYYCPSDEDVAHYLKVVCSPSNGKRMGPEFTCFSKSPIEIGPTNCPFEKRHILTRTRTLKPEELRVVTYNILADLYADSDYSRTVLFGHCPPHALELEYRRQLLLKEISGYNADIICLQEVDRKEFLRTYEPFLKHIGDYSGVFNAKGGQVAEGQATFYRNDKFQLIDSHRTLLSGLIEPFASAELNRDTSQNEQAQEKVEEEGITQCHEQNLPAHPFLNDPTSQESRKCLSKFDKLRSAIQKNQELRKRFIDRHTIIQTTLLKSRDLENSYMLIANTHLYFAPDADHVRLLQGSVCVKYLEHIKEFYRDQLLSSLDIEPKISVIICGDMNSTPDCGLYKLLTQGQVGDDLPDWTSNKEEAVVGLSVETHLRFGSAYEDIKYTNYTLGFNGCLDYIYYDKHALTCESIVPLPSHEDVTAVGGIPSDVFPSDHLALIANLKHSKIDK